MPGQSLLVEGARVAGQGLAGAVLGATPAALYAGLVGAVHLAVYGRWGGVPGFALGCAIAGALAGLLAGLCLARTEGQGQGRVRSWRPAEPSARSGKHGRMVAISGGFGR